MHSNNSHNNHETKPNKVNKSLNQEQNNYHSLWKPPPPPQKWGESHPLSLLSPSQDYSQQSYSEKPHDKQDNFYAQPLSQEISVDKEILKEIKRKSDLYEAAKEQITTKIRNNFEDVIEKIREAENKVLDDVGKELGENPFSTLLARIHSKNFPTDAEIKNVLSKEFPQNSGPNKESFHNLYKEIEYLKTWQMRKNNRLINMTMLPDCAWKKCSYGVDDNRKYSVDKSSNNRIATKVNNSKCYCTVIGNATLPLNKVIGWNIKIFKSFCNGSGINIGVAPSDINQNSDDGLNNGWFFHCGDSTLYSGHPYNYKGRKYGLRRNVKTGGTIGVLMDTTSGELSFIVDGVDYGVSYTRIPLDRPLVPCVLLYYGGDSIELDLSKVKEDVNSSIPVPSEINVKSITWDSITLTWDKIDGTTFYQIEVDGSNLYNIYTGTSFTKSCLHPDSEHNFRIRIVKGNSVSMWSDLVKWRTQKMTFETSGWKEFPGDIGEKKYLLGNENPRIIKVNETGYCTIIGNTLLPMNDVTSWNIKILNSKWNNGKGIFIGAAPFDITQNGDGNNVGKCGWYFDCFESKVIDINGTRQYGPEREKGQYVKTGDKIGIVMDLRKNELSFYLNNMNYGVAFEGILLDKPLVPCIILKKRDDSVELDTSEVKENEVNNSIPVLSKLKVNGVTWNSITLTWAGVKGASIYQIEVDGSKFWDGVTTNSFTKKGFLPETEHSFKVRSVQGSLVSEWSVVVKGKTAKWEDCCIWKECPDYVEEKLKYSVDENNPRIATKTDIAYHFSSIIGNASLPLSKVTSWGIKILKSKYNNGNLIYIGIAPFNINQNKDNNYRKCGWYFSCYGSTLHSGLPHKYSEKEYGSRKEKGKYVHTGDTVGVVMDTTKGELSFVLDGVNLGIAYEGIPLDKPLVPCVLLNFEGDSIELII